MSITLDEYLQGMMDVRRRSLEMIKRIQDKTATPHEIETEATRMQAKFDTLVANYSPPEDAVN